MRRYAKYKDSGVEWIGDIPEGWANTKLKYLITKLITGGTPDTSNEMYWEDDEKGINWISITDITSNGNIIKRTKKSISQLGLKSKNLTELSIGTLIYSVYGSIGKVSRLGIPATIHQGIFGIITNKNLNSYFLEYYLLYFKNYVSIFSSSNTQENLNQEKVLNFHIPLPPLKEQEQIVAYLDEKTSHIDKLLDISKRKIGLLKEQRASIINQVITKGLNPNAKMKHSGVEWIGDIPEGWGVLLLKYFGVITLGKMLTPNEKSGYQLKPYLRSINVQTDKINLSDVKEMWFSNDELERLKLKRGDLLLNEGGDVGRTSVWENELDECYFQNSINRVQFNKEKDLYYYFYYLSQMFHFTGYYKLFVNTVSISHLTKEKLEAVKFIRPPLKEQEQIVAYLDEKTSTIDKSISIEERRIGLLKEYRQSIISQVITGKIKVIADE
jgi:type I restriction enzyme, S subunit